jgi:hypothetical protein
MQLWLWHRLRRSKSKIVKYLIVPCNTFYIFPFNVYNNKDRNVPEEQSYFNFWSFYLNIDWGRAGVWSKFLAGAAYNYIASKHCGFRGLIEPAEADNFKRLSRISVRFRNHIRPWIRALGGIVWWKKTEGRKSCDTVPLTVSLWLSTFLKINYDWSKHHTT